MYSLSTCFSCMNDDKMYPDTPMEVGELISMNYYYFLILYFRVFPALKGAVDGGLDSLVGALWEEIPWIRQRGQVSQCGCLQGPHLRPACCWRYEEPLGGRRGGFKRGGLEGGFCENFKIFDVWLSARMSEWELSVRNSQLDSMTMMDNWTFISLKLFYVLFLTIPILGT